MKNNTKAPLTSAEKANLWNFYMANTMSHCMFQHFLAHVENKQIKEIIKDSDLLRGKYSIANRFFRAGCEPDCTSAVFR
ncbi:DUF3231 family protein [Niallia taxi]|uniref:DUF3231 family protein n=1 Tax=Niallia taxi TaxID=2499688 RepID=UPI00300956F7